MKKRSAETVRVETVPGVPWAELGRLVRAFYADGAVNVCVVPDAGRERCTVVAMFRRKGAEV